MGDARLRECLGGESRIMIWCRVTRWLWGGWGVGVGVDVGAIPLLSEEGPGFVGLVVILLLLHLLQVW